MNRIKIVLDKKGIKQKWLAERICKSFNMVNSYVQNRRQPSLEDLYKIAKILSVSAAELLYNNLQDEESGEIEGYTEKTVMIPVVGDVTCGTPILAIENIETEIPVSVDLVKGSNKYFLLRAIGNSMNLTGINDGDLVLVRQQSTAENGDRVVALINDEATIKEFHRSDQAVILKPRSTESKHKPIILTQEFKIQGVVIATIPI